MTFLSKGPVDGTPVLSTPALPHDRNAAAAASRVPPPAPPPGGDVEEAAVDPPALGEGIAGGEAEAGVGAGVEILPPEPAAKLQGPAQPSFKFKQLGLLGPGHQRGPGLPVLARTA